MLLEQLAQQVIQDFKDAGRLFVAEGRPNNANPAMYHLDILQKEDRLGQVAQLDNTQIKALGELIRPAFVAKHGNRPDIMESKHTEQTVVQIALLRYAATLMVTGRTSSTRDAINIAERALSKGF